MAREETKSVLQMAWPREQNGSMWKLQQESLSNKNTPNIGSPLSRLPLARNAAPAKMAATSGAPRLACMPRGVYGLDFCESWLKIPLVP